MRITRSLALVPAVAVFGLILSAAPAFAQNHHGSTSTHSAPSQSHSAPSQARPQSAPPSASRAPQRVAPQAAQRFDNRPTDNRRVGDPRLDDRRSVAPQRFVAPQRYASPRYGEPRYSSRIYSSHPSYSRYYTFRPRYSLGIGLYLGYPVAFPSWYSYPYGAYNYGYGYGGDYNDPGYVAASPGYGAYGGVSFDISPLEAGIFVDGSYVGVAEDFSPTESPLTLGAGRHKVEIRADGYATQSFDITVVAGQVLPLQGTLAYR